MSEQKIKYGLGKRLKVYVECFLWHLLAPLRTVIDHYLRKKKMFLIYRTWGATLGDAFMVTAIVEALYKQKGYRSIVFTKRPLFFLHNPHVAYLWDYNSMPKLARSVLKSLCKYLRGGQIMCAGIEVWTIRKPPWGDSWDMAYHRWPYFYGFVHEHPTLADWSDYHPRVYFSQEEVREYERKFASLPPDYAIVKASVGVDKRAHKQMKNWDTEKEQEVINRTPYINWVQVGDKGEALLQSTLDMTGKTKLRELFYLVSKAKMVFTIEGLLSHIAAAVDVPSVVIFSWSREISEHKYPTATKVYAESPPPCAPCYRTNCNVDGKPCTASISVEQALAAIGNVWQGRGGPDSSSASGKN